MIKKIPSLFCILSLLLFSLGCERTSSNPIQDPWMAPNGKLKILCTLAMISDLVQQIGGDHVETSTLIKKGLNPHSYQLVKGDNEKLLFADLIFSNGLGLEHGPSLVSFLKNHSKCIAVGEQISREHPHSIIKIDGEIDPHIWMDVSLWSKSIPLITAALSQKDPEHARYFQKNADILIHQLHQLHQQVREQMKAIPEKQRYLITSHDAFNYFGRAYLTEPNEQEGEAWRLRVASPEGIAPESQLGIAHIQQMLDFMIQHNLHVLFPESNVSRDSIRKVAATAKYKGIKTTIATEPLYSDEMGEPGSTGDSYVKMIQHNAKTIAFYLNLDP
jgi:manganese/zinc/iron transport system substrate-binding protein